MLTIISYIIIGLCAGGIIGLFLVHMINHMKEMRELKIFFYRRVKDDLIEFRDILEKHLKPIFEEKKEDNVQQ